MKLSKSLNAWFRSAGILLAGVSLFNLARDFFNFGLSPICRHIVEFYRNFFHPIAEGIIYALNAIAHLFTVQLPPLQKDLFILYPFLASAVLRGANNWRERSGQHLAFWRNKRRQLQVTRYQNFGAYTSTAMAVFWPATFIYLLVGLAMDWYKAGTIARALITELALAGSVFLALFALNYNGS